MSDEGERIKALSLLPGDIIVLETDNRVSFDTLESIKARWKEHVGDHKIVVLDQMRLKVVHDIDRERLRELAHEAIGCDGDPPYCEAVADAIAEDIGLPKEAKV